MGEEEPGAALPKTLVLSYLTNAGSPTHVRRVAASALGIVGVCNLLLAIGAAFYAFDNFDHVRWMYSSFTRYGYDIYDLLVFYGIDLLALISVPLCLSMGVMNLTLVGSVKRGNRHLSRLAFGSLIPLFMLVGIIAAISGGALIYDGLPRIRLYPVLLWKLLPLVFGILIILLLKDLAAYLLWIGRSPLEEKPKVEFLRGIGKG